MSYWLKTLLIPGLPHSWFIWLTLTHSARFVMHQGWHRRAGMGDSFTAEKLERKWQLGYFWSHLQYFPQFYNTFINIYGLDHLKFREFFMSKLNDWNVLWVVLLSYTFSRYQGKHCSLSPGIAWKYFPWPPSTQAELLCTAIVWVSVRVSGWPMV